MQTHVVTRKFAGPGSVQLMPGKQVEAANWPNLNVLINTNYLRALNANEIEDALTEPVIKSEGSAGKKPNPR